MAPQAIAFAGRDKKTVRRRPGRGLEGRHGRPGSPRAGEVTRLMAVKITFQRDSRDLRAMRVVTCYAETEMDTRPRGCSGGGPIPDAQSPYVMLTYGIPGLTLRVVHVYVLRATDPYPSDTELPSQYLDKRSEPILIFTNY